MTIPSCSTLFHRETTLKLTRQVEDLEDVRTVMEVLAEVREKESDIDSLVTPIEEMYALLLRYEVRVPKEETDMVSDLRYSWKKLRKLATDVSDQLTRMQVSGVRLCMKYSSSYSSVFCRCEACVSMTGMRPAENTVLFGERNGFPMSVPCTFYRARLRAHFRLYNRPQEIWTPAIREMD